MTGWSVPQYLHLLAAAGRSLDRQAGQVLTGAGSPKTTWPSAGLDVLVGHHDEEIDHGDEDDEIDNCGNKGAKIDEGLGVMRRAELDAQAGRLPPWNRATMGLMMSVVKAVIRPLKARATTSPTATTITSPRMRKFLKPFMALRNPSDWRPVGMVRSWRRVTRYGVRFR